jgi:D-Tyr-tRNAtyr deacylase
LILLGISPSDTEKECRYLAEKALSLRIFEDENGKMNLGLEHVPAYGAVFKVDLAHNVPPLR